MDQFKVNVIESNGVKIFVDNFAWMTSKIRCDMHAVQKIFLVVK